MFRDRIEAGEQLGERLASLALSDPIVYGLPRGGVEVAAPVADRLGAPLDVLLVTKLRAPRNPELAIGAVGENGIVVLDDRFKDRVAHKYFDREQAGRSTLLEKRAVLYRAGRASINPNGRTVVIVDDGIASGNTALAGVRVVRMLGPSRIIVATPVGSNESIRWIERACDGVICLLTPPEFGAVGQAYDDFSPTPDERVVELLSSRQL